MPSAANWLAWLNASRLRRCAAQIASTSNGRKRRSANILVMSKSKKLGRASGMARFRSGAVNFVQCTIAYIDQALSRVKPLFRTATISGSAGCRRLAPPAYAVPALDPAQPAVERGHGRRKVRRFIAQPHPQCRQIGGGGQLYGQRAA